MAEVVGLAASILQIASTGISLGATLQAFEGGPSRAEQDIADIADRVNFTADTLASVGKVLERDQRTPPVSSKAISDADALMKRSEAVFDDVQDLIEKRSKLGKDGKKSLSASGNLLWPPKEERIELLKRRLGSLHSSLTLLLHVIELADKQANGAITASAVDQEREQIRDLHQRQQDDAKALQVFESSLGIPDDDGLNASSRVPTIDFLVNTSALDASNQWRGVNTSRSQALNHGSETSESDNTLSDDDDSEHLTIEEISHYMDLAKGLLERIHSLRDSYCAENINQNQAGIPRNKVGRIYRRFRREFESSLAGRHDNVPPATRLRESAPHTQQDHEQQHSTSYRPNPTEERPHGALSDPSETAPGRALSSVASSQSGHAAYHDTRILRPASESQNMAGAPVYTISSEPLGSGNRPRLPSLISTVSSTNQTSPTVEALSPSDDMEHKQNGADGDADHGTHEAGPVVYTKTGRISKARKGLKVHVCEQCGRSFTRAEHLRRHQKNHGPNQVQCEWCGKVFFRADLLQRHLERHKNLPQGYRFSTGGASEAGSPGPSDDSQRRPIMPAPVNSNSHVPHSPSGQPPESARAGGAPAIKSTGARQHSAWEPASAVESASEDTPVLQQSGWHSVNSQERIRNQSDTQQSPNNVHRSLQPKPNTKKTGSSPKRYSNILPASNAPDVHHSQASHTSRVYSRPSEPDAKPPQTFAPTMHHQYNSPGHSDQNTKIAQSSRLASESERVIGGHATPLSPRQMSFSQGQLMRTDRSLSPTSGKTSFVSSSKQYSPSQEQRLSSDKDGVDWRVAEANGRRYSHSSKRWTSDHTDGKPSETRNVPDGQSVRRGPLAASLSLVMPQDARDHALVGSIRREDWYDGSVSSREAGKNVPSTLPGSTETPTWSPSSRRPTFPASGDQISPHGISPLNTQVGRETTHRPTGYVDTGSEQKTPIGPPDPESPYSLATINRYVQGQGPQPGAYQDGTSSTACERCREYSIKCDGKLPSCTACATTKYAGECSFASLAARGAMQGVSAASPYESVNAQAQAPAWITRPASGAVQSDQGYKTDEEDLPSPYLKPRDRAARQSVVDGILDRPLTLNAGEAQMQAPRKRKAEEEKHNPEGTGVEGHERKKSKEHHGGGSERTNTRKEPGKGKDIVDYLLGEWTVPV